MERFSDNDICRRDIPSFIEPRPPLINNPFMRPRPQKGTNLLELFEQDSDIVDCELLQVYLRIKPSNEPNNLYDVRSDKCLVTTFDTATAGHGRRTQHNVSRMYTFSQIFGAKCSQKELFEQVVKNNLKKLPDGHSFTLLTYGASGSGKTYTLMGTVNAPGLIPRSLEYVFMLIDASQEPKYKPSETGADILGHNQQQFELQWVKRLQHVSVPQRDKYKRMSVQLANGSTGSNIDLTNRTKHYIWVSFVEIYNEAIYDLLAPPEKRANLRIREDSSGQAYVKGVTQAFVRSGVEAYDVMIAGKHNLVVAATGVHAQSSRSHCIFTITLLTETESGIRTSCIRLCDLAGCERARFTRNTGTRMQESRAINSSLHVLERCLQMLRRNQRQKQDVIVPYRESKLTRLLGSGLSGSRGEAVSMVVTLNPSPQYAQETKHVLSLAAVAQDIQMNDQTTMFMSSLESSTAQDTTITSSAEVMKLRSENELLHFELVQAQTRYKELSAAMDEKQEQAAIMMRELVDEAKDMTKQYYEPQIQRLRDEMDEMIEEYEAKLSQQSAPSVPSVGTPTTYLQAKVAQLMTQNAVLQDEISKEKLARERVEAELDHLQACLDERDEETFNKTNPGLKPPLHYQEEFVLTDSDEESTDIMNQSLAPVFRKVYRKSNANDYGSHNQSAKVEPVKKGEETDTEQNDIDGDGPDKSDYETSDEKHSLTESEDISDGLVEAHRSRLSMTFVQDNGTNVNIDVKSIARSTCFVNKSVADSPISVASDDEATEQPELRNSKYRTSEIDSSNTQTGNEVIERARAEIKEVRGTYFVSPSTFDCSNAENSVNEKSFKPIKVKETVKETESHIEEDVKQIDGPNETVEISRCEVKFASTSVADSSKADNIDNNEYVESEKSKTLSHFVDEIKQVKGHDGVELKNQVRGTYFVRAAVVNSIYAKESENEQEKAYSVKTSDMDTCIDEETQETNEHKAVPNKNTFLTPEKVEYKELKAVTESFVNKIIKTIKKPIIDNSDNSLALFEQLELKCADVSPVTVSDPGYISDKRSSTMAKYTKPATEKRIYFDNIDGNIKTGSKILLDVKSSSRNASETSDITIDNKTSTISAEFTEPVTEKRINFETIEGNIETGAEMLLDIKSSSRNTCETLSDNTIEAFENIYKDLSTQRPTEFELLAVATEIETDISKARHEKQKEIKTDKKNTPENNKEELKYNLRHKNKSVMNTSNDKKGNDEVLLENTGKCQKANHKHSLRLRRHKTDDRSNPDDSKLKDILNLKEEYSDVTMDLPVLKKEVKDIPSPEQQLGEENLPPLLGIQSCPSKSVTRSRRKLFTPRAEPLEECHSETGDSNERLYVPRPSYHRTRARRKLN